MTNSRNDRFGDPATEAGELMTRLGVLVLVVALPIASAFSRRVIFPLPLIGVALLLTGAALAPGRGPFWDRFLPLRTDVGLAIAALLAWSGLALIWTPAAATGEVRFLKTAATLAVVAATACLAPARTKSANLYLLPVGVGAAAACVLALAVFRRQELVIAGVHLQDSTLGRASAELVLFAWPAALALALRERRVLAALTGALALAAVIAVGAPSVSLGAAVGLLAFAASWRWRQRTSLVAALITAGVFALAPLGAWLFGLACGPLASGRNMFANGAALGGFVASEGLKLVIGHGYDAAAQVPEGANIGFALNSLLFETWFELGAIGALLAAVLSAFAFRAAGRITNPLGPYLVGALACGWTIAVAAAPSSELWWLTAASVAGLCFVFALRARYRTKRPRAALTPTAEDARRPAA